MATPEYMKLLPAEALGRMARLEFIARGVVAGFITGRHQSPYKGFSVEFAEHRQYVQGDDLRNMDWRIYGKSDRYYIKQYIEETNLRCTVLLDASASMKYTGDHAIKQDGKRLSKFEYGRHMAAILSYMLVQQQDAVGLVTFDSKMRKHIPARSRASQVRMILEELVSTDPGQDTDLGEIFDDIAERIPRRGLVIIISDMFGDIESILKALHHFKYRKHEVLLFHTMAEEELSFPFESFTDFKDLEPPGVRYQLDPKSIKAEYLDQVRAFIKELQTGCGQMDIDYIPMNTMEPYDVALSNYLASRKGR